MKARKILFASLFCGLSSINISAQGILDKVNQVVSGNSGSQLSEKDIVSGLKEALGNGTGNTTKLLGATDGFLANNAVKILLPPETYQVQQALKKMGLGSVTDRTITSMNRAAEDAVSSIGPIFLDAIKQMTFTDAIGILRGGDFAATDYLKRTTSPQLIEKMRPSIESSLKKVNATAYWNDFFKQYNRISMKKVNPDLVDHVCQGALAGIFYQLGQEEQKIRKDPAARTTDILRKVFGN